MGKDYVGICLWVSLSLCERKRCVIGLVNPSLGFGPPSFSVVVLSCCGPFPLLACAWHCAC